VLSNYEVTGGEVCQKDEKRQAKDNEGEKIVRFKR
jgi:hypothetical protein